MIEHTPTVWLVNDAGHPTYDAERFGDVRPLSIGNTNPLKLDRVVWHFSKGIAKYTHRDDFLCIMGTPMLSGVAVSLWLMRHRVCKVLQWNAKFRRYELSVLTYEHMLNTLDSALRS